MTVHCRECKHQWDVILPLPMSLDRAVTVMNGACAAGCPVCKAHGDAVICGSATAADRWGTMQRLRKAQMAARHALGE